MCIFCEKAQNQLADGGGLTSSQKREAEQCERLRERRIRATILTGFLGAGKTTFLNFVLKSLSHGKRIGVVQNEFGSVSVDDQLMLVEKTDAEVITMPNGCLCCRVRGDMVDALKRLAQRPGSPGTLVQDDGAAALDHLIIECSGLSEVIPVAQTFFADPFVQASFNLDGVVCVCDASNFSAMEGGSGGQHGAAAGDDVARLLREQLSISDVCLLNKCDLVDSAQRDALGRRIHELSPSIKVVPCRHGKVNLGQVLKLNSFSLESALSLDAHFLGGPQPRQSGERHGLQLMSSAWSQSASCSKAGAGAGHAHAAFGSLGLETAGPMDLEKLKAWLRGVVEKHSGKLIRIKGIIRVPGPEPSFVIVQGVGGHIDVGEEGAALAAGAAGQGGGGGGGAGGSRLVLIGRLLGDGALQAELREGFAAAAAAAADGMDDTSS